MFQNDAAQVIVPDANEVWRELQSRLAQPDTKPLKKRPLAPVIWFGTSLAAAAAALTLAYLGTFTSGSHPAPLTTPTGQVAQADYVEAGNQNATTMVFSDQESGWLVVWATETDSGSSG